MTKLMRTELNTQTTAQDCDRWLFLATEAFGIVTELREKVLHTMLFQLEIVY